MSTFHVSASYNRWYARVSRVAYHFFFNDTATTEIYTLSLHDALPILVEVIDVFCAPRGAARLCASAAASGARSEEHTSELQSRLHLVCRLLLEKKNKIQTRDLVLTTDYPYTPQP